MHKKYAAVSNKGVVTLKKVVVKILPERPEELYFSLLEYFEIEDDGFKPIPDAGTEEK